MATTAGAVVSSAIVGAGLGAITAKVTGGSVKAGAISGLIGGGIGGYTSAAKPGMFGNPAQLKYYQEGLKQLHIKVLDYANAAMR